ncbi:hypothetical protein [uncultured Parabacteroides sp.]|uniref:hypothetical protein n=1 Tax=uncultured Parabacteroides sp. TaxID=512312 RepID=UPI00265DAE5F|nr:hypothetical protein [uncultured Parabacteroides sp.]
MKRKMMFETEQQNQDAPYVTIGGVKWAPTSIITDINTGNNYFAEKPETLGSVFQWGRKYGAPSTVTTAISGQLTIIQGESLINASKLIGNSYSSSPSSYHYAWCNETGTSAYTRLWMPGKGQYDPCPADWRVPTRDELNVLFNAAYKSKGYVNGVYGYFFGNNSQNTMFVPFQPMLGWGLGTLDSSFVALQSCTLGTSNTHYQLDFMKNTDEIYLRTLFQSTSGIIRAVKI